jgi:hypothetical protein
MVVKMADKNAEKCSNIKAWSSLLLGLKMAQKMAGKMTGSELLRNCKKSKKGGVCTP